MKEKCFYNTIIDSVYEVHCNNTVNVKGQSGETRDVCYEMLMSELNKRIEVLEIEFQLSLFRQTCMSKLRFQLD